MRECIIAAYYFSNKLPSNFIQVQSNMNFLNVKKRILATAWDFLLLRMPEIALMGGSKNDTTLGYVCSADEAVRKLGRLFTNEMISSSKNQMSTLSFKSLDMRKDLGDEITHKLLSKLDDLQIRRKKKLINNGINPILKDKLDGLVSSLEEQIKLICKN